jgi:hypothetical protein
VVLVHVDEVEVKFTANGPTPTGGHLARVTDWPIEAREGWYATPNALMVARGEPPPLTP